MKLRGALTGLALVGALACSLGLYSRGTWRLVPSESALHFIGTKNNAVAVPGVFTSLDGAYDVRMGTAFVEVKLATADTGNAARDENIRNIFFEAAKYPVARLDVTQLMPRLMQGDVPVSGTLSLHGASVPLKALVRVTLDAEHRLHVHNVAPLVLSAHELGMDAQLSALKAVCGHESLSGAIPIEFDLAFARAGDD